MAQPELVYWKGSGDVRTDLLQAIKIAGYNLTVVMDIDDVAARPEHNLPKLIVVDASAGEAEASQRIIEVTAVCKKFQAIPLIFISYHASKRAAVLKKAFVKLVPIDVPFRLQDLLRQLLEICPVEVEKPKQEEAKSVAANESQASADSQAAGAQRPDKNLVNASVFKRPLIVRADEEALSLGSGGEFFALAERLDQIDDASLLSEHPNLAGIEGALKQMTARDSVAGIHARRVAALASVISRKMGFVGDLHRSVRIAGLLLNWGLVEKYPRLVSYDLLLSQDPSKHKIIGGALAESAKYVRDNIKDELAASTIEIVSKLILRINVESSDSLLRAQCALVPELAERSTWSMNKWDSNGAYRSIRKLADSKIYSIPTQLVTELTKSLSEASSARAMLTASTNPPPLNNDEREIEKIAIARQEAQEAFAGKNKSNIRICALESGMKLAEPVVSLSGKLLLKANISLTDEILESLWRTSIMTPVKPDIAISA